MNGNIQKDGTFSEKGGMRGTDDRQAPCFLPSVLIMLKDLNQIIITCRH
jgi:hypothetical protein